MVVFTPVHGHGIDARADTRRLGACLLLGHVADPVGALRQAQAAEEVGIRSVWLSERFGSKDVAAVAGALTEAANSLAIGAAATLVRLRHPMASASMALTMRALSGGRFVLGVGRSGPAMSQQYGLPSATKLRLIDGLDVVRRLCSDETVSYVGPLGDFPRMQLIDRPNVAPPPVVLPTSGPKSPALARSCDGVVLHPSSPWRRRRFRRRSCATLLRTQVGPGPRE